MLEVQGNKVTDILYQRTPQPKIARSPKYSRGGSSSGIELKSGMKLKYQIVVSFLNYSMCLVRW